MRDRGGRAVLLWQIGILVAILAAWQYLTGVKAISKTPGLYWIDPFFISRPSAIAERFAYLSSSAVRLTIWQMALSTVESTLWGFLVGVSTGFAAGLLLGRNDRLARILEPYIVAFNSLPRIALVPLVTMIFGFGLLAKIVLAWTIVFFIVFFNTFQGARSVDADLIHSARFLGATEGQILRSVIVPSAMAWTFASLTPSISFALIGVVVGEFHRRRIGRRPRLSDRPVARHAQRRRHDGRPLDARRDRHRHGARDQAAGITSPALAPRIPEALELRVRRGNVGEGGENGPAARRRPKAGRKAYPRPGECGAMSRPLQTNNRRVPSAQVSPGMQRSGWALIAGRAPSGRPSVHRPRYSRLGGPPSGRGPTRTLVRPEPPIGREATRNQRQDLSMPSARGSRHRRAPAERERLPSVGAAPATVAAIG